jgi:hypothetical protein
MKTILIMLLAAITTLATSTKASSPAPPSQNSSVDATSRTQGFRGIGKLINRHRLVWLEVFGDPLYGKGIYDVWSKGGLGTPIGIGMTVIWDHSTGVRFHRDDSSGTTVIEQTKETGRHYIDRKRHA